MKKFQPLLLVLVLLVCSCKKKLTEKRLTGTRWILTSLVRNSSTLNIWVYPYTRTCQLDNYYEFRDNNVYELNDVGEICTSPAVGKTGYWEVREGRLIFEGNQWDVKSYTKDELVLNAVGDVMILKRYN